MKYNFEWTENDYKTPPVLYQMALERFQRNWFNLDACCTDFNIPSNYYAKKDGLYALTQKIREEDGLTTEWLNYTWCNPPFNECKKWIEKVYKFLNKDNQEMGVFKNALALVYFE